MLSDLKNGIEQAARQFSRDGGSWYTRIINGNAYLHVDVTSQDLARLKGLHTGSGLGYIVRAGRPETWSWRITRQDQAQSFLRKLMPYLPAAKQLRLATALGRTRRIRKGPWAAQGAVLRQLRKRSGLTQVQLAHRVGRKAWTIHRIEVGYHPVTKEVARWMERELKAPGLAALAAVWRQAG